MCRELDLARQSGLHKEIPEEILDHQARPNRERIAASQNLANPESDGIYSKLCFVNDNEFTLDSRSLLFVP